VTADASRPQPAGGALDPGRARRRPSGTPPPLPHHIARSGFIWLGIAVVALGAAVATFAGGLTRWAIKVTVIDDAVTRRIVRAPVPGLTGAARGIAAAGAAPAIVIAAYALLLALIVLRRFRHLLVLLLSLPGQIPVIVGYISRATLQNELALRSGGRLRLDPSR
jgi:hypothetical protein